MDIDRSQAVNPRTKEADTNVTTDMRDVVELADYKLGSFQRPVPRQVNSF